MHPDRAYMAASDGFVIRMLHKIVSSTNNISKNVAVVYD